MSDKREYGTIRDVEDYYVIPSLGDFVHDFDTREIAQRITHYANGCIVLNDISSDEYWEVVEECALTDEDE